MPQVGMPKGCVVLNNTVLGHHFKLVHLKDLYVFQMACGWIFQAMFLCSFVLRILGCH
jgi:hypothetical protein